MFKPSRIPSIRSSGLRLSAALSALAQKQPVRSVKPHSYFSLPKESSASYKEQKKQIQHVKRNELGVQLLSRNLHSQIFSDVSFPSPERSYVRVAQRHLRMHGLDPKQGSVLPDTSFILPPLQGRNIDEHFYQIGDQSSQPWLEFARKLSSSELPPRPECWDVQSGWTKYHLRPDGSRYSERVAFPEHNGQAEQMLVFDVETMPNHHPYAIMACAASPHAWYCWISPWFIGESSDAQHLVPMGDPKLPRIIVGHNVSYDRARILEEYNLHGTEIRFLDTMALHVAVKGISSHQRPAWMKYRKSKESQEEKQSEAATPMVERKKNTEPKLHSEADVHGRDELRRLRIEVEDTLQGLHTDGVDVAESDLSSKRWEELTSANSLADVAKLHCKITVDKAIRDDFMTKSPSEILTNIQHYLGYCSQDVFVTHAVSARVLPDFLDRCPSPVSFAGVLTMGSSFLTVNESWEAYLRDSEQTYIDLENKVKLRLIALAEEAKSLAHEDKWNDDVWLSQLDWTPKVAGKSRGIGPSLSISSVAGSSQMVDKPLPSWFNDVMTQGPLHVSIINKILPLLLKLSCDEIPLRHSKSEKWHYLLDGNVCHLPGSGQNKVLTVLGRSHGLRLLRDGRMNSNYPDLATAIASGDKSNGLADQVLALARAVAEQTSSENIEADPWLSQLDWTLKHTKRARAVSRSKSAFCESSKDLPVFWPKWYWDLAKPKKGLPPGTLDITVRNRIAPILLRLSWLGWPLFHSRQHGWVFRVPNDVDFPTRSTPLEFYDPADDRLQDSSLRGGFIFYKLPHKDGEQANVGSPLGKTFMKFAQDGTLTSPGDEAKDALDMNAQCSYWISARDRILKQMVVWQDDRQNIGFTNGKNGATTDSQKWGIILPQVITMGTVTRRAIEKTWLTASNAKKNRVGSELKAMVRAPKGYAIVGADVDSEELWISSCMGDAQFGLHGSTAIGWMTLEGTKAAGTDLHSKTASILGISRDQAKVFNYSRIYGAGMRHAVLLLLQSNPSMLPDQAQKLAENLYASTKGKNTHSTDSFGRKFWFGGTESFVFNKLEEIALSDRPQTPALGCGITYALSKEYLPAEFGSDYMTSRVNWVVQSSGVDYLHLLIVSMNHLLTKYDIKARYLISVHDELRYLVADEDKYRAALALQIANLWTRSLFAYKLGMDDLPQGVAFFSAVDVDSVLRKEVDMECVTPSHPNPIAPGESLNISQILEKTSGGSLWRDGRPMAKENVEHLDQSSLNGYTPPDCLKYRAESATFLRAQATKSFPEVKRLSQQLYGKQHERRVGTQRKTSKRGHEEDFLMESDWL